MYRVPFFLPHTRPYLQGAFGRILMGVDGATGMNVAVKELLELGGQPLPPCPTPHMPDALRPTACKAPCTFCPVAAPHGMWQGMRLRRLSTR